MLQSFLIIFGTDLHFSSVSNPYIAQIFLCHCCKYFGVPNRKTAVPVRRDVKPVFGLQSCAHKSTSMARNQIKLLSDFNAHVQRLIGGVVFTLCNAQSYIK